MITDTPREPTTAPSSGTPLYLLKLLAGPAAFGLVLALPLALSYQGRIALATFVCAIVWWMTQPVPWAMAAMLPFLVFPAAGVMDITETMRLYGQPMGSILRCPDCSAALIRVVVREPDYWLDMRGVESLRISLGSSG